MLQCVLFFPHCNLCSRFWWRSVVSLTRGASGLESGGCHGLNHLKTGDVGHIQHLQHLLGIWINLDQILLVNVGHLWYIIVSALTLLFLKFDRNATHWCMFDTFHQMGNESSNLVTQPLAWDYRNFFADTLVRMKIHSKTHMILFNDHARRLFDRLGPDTTHFDGL